MYRRSRFLPDKNATGKRDHYVGIKSGERRRENKFEMWRRVGNILANSIREATEKVVRA